MQPPTSSDVILCLNILQCIVYILSLQGVFVVKLQQQLHMFLGEFIDIGKRHRKENKNKNKKETFIIPYSYNVNIRYVNFSCSNLLHTRGVFQYLDTLKVLPKLTSFQNSLEMTVPTLPKAFSRLLLIVLCAIVFVNECLSNKKVTCHPNLTPSTFFFLNVKIQFGQHIMVFCKWVSYQWEGHFRSKVDFLNLFSNGKNLVWKAQKGF